MNREIGGLDCTVITTEYRTRVVNTYFVNVQGSMLFIT